MADDGYGSRENLRRRSAPQSVASDTPAAAGFYQPGQPIGFIRARGSPYEKKYFSRKLGYCCLFVAPGVLLVTLAITLLPVLYAVANHALHTAVLHVYESNITNPTNTSFPLTLEGQTKKVGIFPAHLYFREPVQVYWVLPPEEGQVASPETLTEINLGQFRLDYIGAAAGHARIKQVRTSPLAPLYSETVPCLQQLILPPSFLQLLYYRLPTLRSTTSMVSVSLPSTSSLNPNSHGSSIALASM